MNRIISRRELRNKSAAVLRAVQAGQSMLVARNGTPIAELRPIQPCQFIPRATIAKAEKSAPRLDAAWFRTDLDGVIDPFVDS